MKDWLIGTLSAAGERLERYRVRTHLYRTWAELAAKPLPADPVLAARRLANLARLKEYAERGRYPKNEDFPGAQVPSIRDRSGTLCAMAHLIAGSGDGALVDSLARECNHVRIPSVAGGPLLAWLAGSGLTQAEAGRIQPGYSWQHGGLRGRPFRAVPRPEPVLQAHQAWDLQLCSAAVLLAGYLVYRLSARSAACRAAKRSRQAAERYSTLRMSERSGPVEASKAERS